MQEKNIFCNKYLNRGVQIEYFIYDPVSVTKEIVTFSSKQKVDCKK